MTANSSSQYPVASHNNGHNRRGFGMTTTAGAVAVSLLLCLCKSAANGSRSARRLQNSVSAAPWGHWRRFGCVAVLAFCSSCAFWPRAISRPVVVAMQPSPSNNHGNGLNDRGVRLRTEVVHQVEQVDHVDGVIGVEVAGRVVGRVAQERAERVHQVQQVHHIDVAIEVDVAGAAGLKAGVMVPAGVASGIVGVGAGGQVAVAGRVVEVVEGLVGGRGGIAQGRAGGREEVQAGGVDQGGGEVRDGDVADSW